MNSTATPKPLFVTLEGLDGSGKSTQLEALVGLLEASGRPVIVTREPGGTPLGERIRGLVLAAGTMSAESELLLILAARSEHLAAVINPALAAGKSVVCDRYLDATYAYQGYGRGLALALIDGLVAALDIRAPDLTLLFDLPCTVAAQRRGVRDADRIEAAGPAFFDRVRAGYLACAAAAPQRIVVIDANNPEDRVAAMVQHAVAARL
ncbi:MAG: dTMP kinase [Acidiferrobacter sp.]